MYQVSHTGGRIFGQIHTALVFSGFDGVWTLSLISGSLHDSLYLLIDLHVRHHSPHAVLLVVLASRIKF
jgi:hypothetical protein